MNKFLVLLCLLQVTLLCHLVDSSYHILVADPSRANSSPNDLLSRNKRSVLDPGDILNGLVGSHSSGNVQDDEKETLSFFVKNIDLYTPARMNLNDVIPNDAVLTGFTINNEAAVYELSHQRQREKDEVLREFDDAVAGGYSAVMIGDVQPSEELCAGCRSASDNGQPVNAQINVAPLDVLSVSISFYITKDSGADVHITIDLEEPATNIEGVLFSPNYPASYPNNSDISWNIFVPDIVENLIINATLLAFDLDRNDNLQVFDGSQKTHPLLLDAALSDLWSSVYSTGTDMLVTFNSGDRDGGSGFALQFITMIPVTTAKPTFTTVDTTTTAAFTTTDTATTAAPTTTDTATTAAPTTPDTTTTAAFTTTDTATTAAPTTTDTATTAAPTTPDTTTTAAPTTPDTTTTAAPTTTDTTTTAAPTTTDTTTKAVPITTDTTTTKPTGWPSLGECLSFIHVNDYCDVREGVDVNDEEINAASGSVFSPGYPFEYPRYPSVLSWIIKATEKVVYVTIIDVDIRDSDLSINFSSDSTPTKITPATEEGLVLAQVSDDDVEIYLKFTADEKSYSSKSPRGFYLHFISAEPEELQLSANDNSWKEIKSHDGGGLYEAETDQTWMITAPESSGIEIKIIDFNLEERYDFLFIYEVHKNNSGILKTTLSGNNAKDVTFSLATNVALLRFVSDTLEERTGFTLHYRATALSAYTSTESRSLNVSYGLLRSPSYPQYTRSNETTEWLVQAESGQVIKFWVEQYKTNTTSYITFYDGSTAGHPQITTFTDKDDYSIISTANEVLVVLSRGPYSYDSRSYFISFSVMEQEDAYCNGDQRALTEPSGVIESPAYPLKPTPNTRCNYLIQLPSTAVVLATFEYVGLYPYDLFEVFDGDSMSSPLLKSCGTCNADDTIAATGNSMFIRYVAEPANRGQGFKLHYQDQTAICSNVVRTFGRDSGIATSPNFPGNYPNNIRCNYAITVPFDSVIHYYFESFDTGPGDILTINDIRVRNPKELSGRKIGYSGVSTDNILTMVFESGAFGRHPGFRMMFSSRSDSMLSIDQAYSYVVINDNHDVNNPLSLLSPGFPNTYPSDFDFLWYFETSASNTLNFEFHKMEIDRSDFINIFSSIGTDPNHLIATVNGQNYDSGAVQNVDNYNATVWFHTDGMFEGQGFLIKYYFVH